jgi:hypothetical protein
MGFLSEATRGMRWGRVETPAPFLWVWDIIVPIWDVVVVKKGLKFWRLVVAFLCESRALAD